MMKRLARRSVRYGILSAVIGAGATAAAFYNPTVIPIQIPFIVFAVGAYIGVRQAIPSRSADRGDNEQRS